MTMDIRVLVHIRVSKEIEICLTLSIGRFYNECSPHTS